MLRFGNFSMAISRFGCKPLHSVNEKFWNDFGSELRMPATQWQSVDDFLEGSRQAFVYFNSELGKPPSKDRSSRLKSILSKGLLDALNGFVEGQDFEEDGVELPVVIPEYDHIEAYLTGFLPPKPKDSKNSMRTWMGLEYVRERGDFDDQQVYANVTFLSKSRVKLMSGGVDGVDDDVWSPFMYRKDSMTFSAPWDSLEGIQDWRISDVN